MCESLYNYDLSDANDVIQIYAQLLTLIFHLTIFYSNIC